MAIGFLKLLLAKQFRKMTKKSNKNIPNESAVMLDGMMVFGKLDNGLRYADFECCEDAEMEAFSGNCKVQIMRDGNVYITELPKRIRNRALFRDDNCSLSLGKNGKFYFVFSMPEEQIDELPEQLVRQASAIAGKMIRILM
jgi:hypothetical protein